MKLVKVIFLKDYPPFKKGEVKIAKDLDIEGHLLIDGILIPTSVVAPYDKFLPKDYGINGYVKVRRVDGRIDIIPAHFIKNKTVIGEVIECVNST